MSIMVPPIAMRCWTEVVNKLKLIPELADKTESVWDEDHLLSILKGARFPMVGVVYGGITGGTGPDNMGISSTLTISILLMLEGSTVRKQDEKPEGIRLLDLMRDAMLTRTSPTGHKWKFVREFPLGKENDKVVFSQVWSTVVQLTASTVARP